MRWPTASPSNGSPARDITEAHWDAFFAFYMDTGSRKWGRPYLNRAFFSLIGERMADRVLLVMAKRDGRHIAGAINFIGDKRALRAQLGLHRGSPLPAFRGLLLPGHRIRHRPRPRPGRGRGAGRAQAGARLPARDHLIGPRHRRSVAPPGHRRPISIRSASTYPRRPTSSRRPLRSSTGKRIRDSGRRYILPAART